MSEYRNDLIYTVKRISKCWKDNNLYSSNKKAYDDMVSMIADEYLKLGFSIDEIRKLVSENMVY